jgi:hypothetical protein
MSDFDDVIKKAVSDEVEIDFSAATDYEPLTPGDYDAVLISAVPGTSQKGNPKLTFEFEVASDKGKRKVFRHAPVSGAGAGLAKEVIKALGFNVDDPKIKFRPSEAKGRKVKLTLGIQESNPQYNEITRVKAAVSELKL